MPGDLEGDYARRNEAGRRVFVSHDALSKVARVIYPDLDTHISAARALTGPREHRTPK